MKTLLSLKKSLAVSILASLVMGAASPCRIAQAADFNPQPDPPGFGMLGIAAGQTARLNVSLDNLAGKAYPPDPYRVTLYFLNGDGRVLTQQTFPVMVGQPALLDYAAPFIKNGQRQRIRPIVMVEPDASGSTPDLRSVVEVINDDTQLDAIVYPGEHNPPADNVTHNPPVFYDSGVVGIARGQSVRLNVVNTLDVHNPVGIPPDPYRVTLSFYGGDGSLLAQTFKFIAPGQAASLEVNASRFEPNQGSRLALHAVVSVDADVNGIAPCVMPTLEGFNTADGKTTFLIPAH